MKKTSKIVVSSFAILVAVLALAITVTIGWQPFVGPRARPLTDRRIAPTADFQSAADLAGETALSLCMAG